MKKRLLGALLLASTIATSVCAQQLKEKLNRAPVAVKTSTGVLVSWRSFSADAKDLSFDVYRNGTKIGSNITRKTNLHDTMGKAGYTYRIEASNGETFETKAWANICTTFDAKRPAPQVTAGGSKGKYRPDDMSVGDLDGDGDYELVLKWMPDNQKDNSQKGYTSPCIIDAYKLDGTFLWRINLGLNIRSGNHYTQFLVYDFDGDGKAEVMCKTAPGSKDSEGNYVTEAATDATIRKINNSKTYVNSNGHVTGGEELLTVFNGETGKAMHTVWYNPNRAMTTGNKSMSYGSWESENGKSANYNRGERYNAAVAYLDGLDHLPSAIFQRGYYSSCFIWAVDWNGIEISTKWIHKGRKGSWSVDDKDGKSIASGTGKSSFGQGVHGISIGDVDGDGKDEIVTGSATIDHNGSLLCSTGKGHGDAIHLAPLFADSNVLGLMMPHEEKPYGYDVHNPSTGALLINKTSSGDNGRGLAADFIPFKKGYEFWTSADDNIYSCTTGNVILDKKPDTNFRIYWTGDPFDQTFDGRYDKNADKFNPRIRYYNTNSKSINTFIEFNKHGEPQACNTTKATPCLQADILGDWREELVMFQYEADYSSDVVKIMIFSTPEPTIYKVPCLMEDHVYRMGIAWQNSSYNQPPHLGYSLAEYVGAGTKYTINPTSHAPAYKDVETGIKDVKVTKPGNGIMYNLKGQKVCRPVSGEIYILNGKKFIFKK